MIIFYTYFTTIYIVFKKSSFILSIFLCDPEPVVDAPVLQEFFVPASFDDAAVIHDDNRICILYS